MLFTDPFPCILLRLWIRWCYIHTDMGGGDRKRRAIHFKTFKSLHVIFLFLQAEKASRESQGYVCIGTIQDPPGTKSKVSVPLKNQEFSHNKMSIECKIFLHITADLTGTSRNLFAVLCLEGKHCISDSTKCASRNSRIHKEKSRQLPCSDRRQYKPFKEKIISIEDVY